MFIGYTNAQSLQLDTTFNTSDIGFDYGAGFAPSYYGYVSTTVVQSDGKIIITSNNYYNGVSVNKPIRLNADGSIDPTFNFNGSIPTGSTMTFKSAAIQPDGKVIYVGDFSFYNMPNTNSYYSSCEVFRVNTDGTVDTSFRPVLTPTTLSIYDCAVQEDGKVLLGGKFTAVGSVMTNCIARFNNDGSLDNTFNPLGAGPLFGYQDSNDFTNVSKIKILPNNKIMIVGNFGAYNGVARKNIARLNADGTLDLSFDPGTGINGYNNQTPPVLNAMELQPDGKLLVGGQFSSYNGTTKWGIIRINEDGTVDSGFTVGQGFYYLYQGASNSEWSGKVYTIFLQANGKIIVGGVFQKYNGISQNNIVRLNTDGTLDTSFNDGIGIYDINSTSSDDMSIGGIRSLNLLNNGRILISGKFKRYDNTIARCLIVVDSEGNIDTNFNTVTGFDWSVNCSAFQPDGKILVGGYFTKYYNQPKRGLVRLNTDGSLDAGFGFGSGIYTTSRIDVDDLSVRSILVQPDNKIIVAGHFNYSNGVAKNSIVRLNENGSVDAGFVLAPSIESQIDYGGGIYKMVLQPDGKILLVVSHNMYRLNTDGSKDSTFNPPSYSYSSVFSLQPDGKILTFYNDLGYKLSRLNTTGTIDLTFTTVLLSNVTSTTTINVIEVQPDNKILIAGNFTNVNGNGVQCMARLDANGAIDMGFYLPSISNVTNITAFKVMPNNKIMVAGIKFGEAFLSRLSSLGVVEESFSDSQIEPADAKIYDINIQNNGYIYIGGSFTSFGTEGRNRFARLYDTSLGNDSFISSNGRLKIYPNPTTDFLNIDVKADYEINEMEVFNMMGQKVITCPNVLHEKTIDVSALQMGTYFVKMNTSHGIISKTFIKD